MKGFVLIKVVDISKCPFLVDINELLNTRYPGLRLEDILKNPDSYPFNRSLEILESIITKNTIKQNSSQQQDEVIAFYSLLIGASAVGSRGLVSRIALFYSKYSSNYLLKESLENTVFVARKLGLSVEIESNPPRIVKGMLGKNTVVYIAKPVSIDIKQYLNIVSKKLAHDPKYMLVNQIVSNGKVYIDKETLVRLLEEVIYKKIIEFASRIEFNHEEITVYLSKFRELLERNNWFENKQISLETAIEATDVKYQSDKLPPCMKNIIGKIESSDNPSHHERFALASFLVHIGLDTETILEFFKKTPDFNERIARYQIEHISGLRGSRKKYLPYNCDNMKNLGICPINKYCEGGKNPLQVYKYSIRSTARKMKRTIRKNSGKVVENNDSNN